MGAEKSNWVYPWEEPPLDKWYLIAMNHQIRGKKNPMGRRERQLFAAMTYPGKNIYIEAHGPDAEAVFLSLRRQARAWEDYMMGTPGRAM